jgi:hypothetical protein
MRSQSRIDCKTLKPPASWGSRARTDLKAVPFDCEGRADPEKGEAPTIASWASLEPVSLPPAQQFDNNGASFTSDKVTARSQQARLRGATCRYSE